MRNVFKIYSNLIPLVSKYTLCSISLISGNAGDQQDEFDSSEKLIFIDTSSEYSETVVNTDKLKLYDSEVKGGLINKKFHLIMQQRC